MGQAPWGGQAKVHGPLSFNTPEGCQGAAGLCFGRNCAVQEWIWFESSPQRNESNTQSRNLGRLPRVNLNRRWHHMQSISHPPQSPAPISNPNLTPLRPRSDGGSSSPGSSAIPDPGLGRGQPSTHGLLFFFFPPLLRARHQNPLGWRALKCD